MNINDFDTFWKRKQYKKALDVYHEHRRPFWMSLQVGKYLEKQGKIEQAMRAYESLMEKFIGMKILPLPLGPVELLKLGKWYMSRSRRKARRYLRLYLSASADPYGCGRRLPHKKLAMELLRKCDED